MKGKIKVLSLVLAMAMMSSMFVACKGDKKAADDGDTSNKVEEISWYVWGDKPTQDAPVIKALNEKSAEDIGVKVNFKWQTSNDESLRTTLASGDSDVDVAFATSWFADYVGSAQKNYFMDLTDLIPKYAPKLNDELPDTLWKGVRVNGKVFGVPVWKDTAATQYWLARKDILENAEATDEFAKAGRAVSTLTPTLEKIKAWHDADPENNKYSEGNTAAFNMNKAGLNGHNTGWDELSGDVYVGVKIEEGNTTVSSYFEDEDFVNDMKTMKDWADRGLSNGKVALQIEQEAKLITVGTAQGWDGAQFTAWGGPTKGYDTLIQKKVGPFLTSASVQGGVNVVGAGSKKVETALKFLEYVNTDADYRNMLTYGIKDTNWKMNGDVVERLTGQDWAPGNFALGSWKYLIPEVGNPATMYEDLCDMTNTATPSELLGFVPNTENVLNELAACTSIVKDSQEPLRCGAVKNVDEEIAKIIKKLEGQGYRKIIAEYQKQVDEFLASK